MENSFLKKAMEVTDNVTFTENGAVAYKSVGNELMTQFSTMGSARGRDIEEVWSDQEALWNENPEAAIKFPFFIRLISRDTKVGINKDEMKTISSNGCGQRDESFKRLLWIEKYHSEKFYNNLWLLPAVGSWKDLVSLYVMNPEINTKEIFKVIAKGMVNPEVSDLIWKYMPRIHSLAGSQTKESKLKVEFAKKFCKETGLTVSQYRKMKSSGKAHEFQQLICSRKYSKIDWDKVPGVALLRLVSGNFMENHGLVKNYMKWLESKSKLNFNGFPVDLRMAYKVAESKVARLTIDAQFENLIDRVRNEDRSSLGNVLCALDTSGSMGNSVNGTYSKNSMTALDVCLSLGVYFSELNTGAFHNVVAMFDDVTTLKTLHGSFTDKLDQIREFDIAWGSTNFQSIINTLIDVRKSDKNIPLEEYPNTILVVSDMQFNPSYGYTGSSNIDDARAKLKKYFPAEWVNSLRFIWWNCIERGTKNVPATIDETNSLLLSGYDGNIMSLITSIDNKKRKDKTTPTMEDLVNEALGQEILTLVQ